MDIECQILRTSQRAAQVWAAWIFKKIYVKDATSHWHAQKMGIPERDIGLKRKITEVVKSQVKEMCPYAIVT